MSCCGGKRAQLSAGRPVRQRVAELDAPHPPVVRHRETRTFVYVGDTSLTVRGAVSGAAYRFAYPGARIEVAADDVFAMMAERDVRPSAAAGAVAR